MLESQYLGLIEYGAGLQIQSDLFFKSQKSQEHFIIGLEHPSVVTLGYRAVAAIEVHPENLLRVERTNRGGFATLHSEGQLVIYPVVNLRKLKLGVRDFICILLETTKKLLQNYGVSSFVNENALGLYTKKGKIAFCGIHVSHGITQHGISININNDLGLFKNIRSCGIEAARFDRLAEHKANVELALLYSQWVDDFKLRIDNLVAVAKCDL